MPLDNDSASGLLAFVHKNHPVQLKDTQITAQTFIAASEKPVTIAEFETPLQQTWDFPEARRVVSQSHATVLVTDFMSETLDYHERLDLFHRALLSVLSVIPCQAIHWQPSSRIVDPRQLLQASVGDPAQLFFAGAINVRLFNIANSSGEMIMDTLGLAALGIPDLQCHFHKLDTNQMARVLYNTAWYVFQNGDVIQDGHTVEGTQAGSKWRCKHEWALAEPRREVLDLDPGRKFAAGKRN